MNRDQISQLAHADHPVAAPLDDESVHQLLVHAIPHDDARVLDLGCGTGEWLLRALSMHPRLRAEGVDVSENALTHARRNAGMRGVRERLVLHHENAVNLVLPHTFDLVISVGARHAFGSLLSTLTAARKHLAPGGRVLIGDGFWTHEPTPEAIETLGELFDLPAMLDHIDAAGWTPAHGHISTRRELDDYEWSWTGSLTSWSLDHPDHPDASQALATATAHRSEWLRTYRDTFGFICLILRQTP